MTDNTELKRLADELIAANDLFNESPQDNEAGDVWSLANDRFTEAASPEVILALIAENDAALREATSLAMAIWRRRYAKDSPNFQTFEKASSVIGQIDNMAAGLMSDLERLKAENEALRKDAERYRWLREYNKPESEAPFICQQRLMFGKLYYAGPLVAGALDQEVDSFMSKGEKP